MERQNNLLFTLWYGVFERGTRRLTYSSGGHPPAVLLESQSSPSQNLSTGGRVLGCDPAAEYRNESRGIRRGSRLYVFSDGAYEITRPDGKLLQLSDLITQLAQPTSANRSKLDQVMEWATAMRGGASLEDDLSLLQIEF